MYACFSLRKNMVQTEMFINLHRMLIRLNIENIQYRTTDCKIINNCKRKSYRYIQLKPKKIQIPL